MATMYACSTTPKVLCSAATFWQLVVCGSSPIEGGRGVHVIRVRGTHSPVVVVGLRALRAIAALAFALALLFVVALARASNAPPRLELTESEQAFLGEHPVIRVGVDPEFHPFEFIDEDGNYKGIAADYLRLLEERLGVRFEVRRALSWPEVIEAVRRKELDLLPAVGRTQQRVEFLSYSQPYVGFHRVMITRTDMPFLSGIEDLEELKVAVQRSSSHDGYLSENTQLNLLRFPTLDQTLRAVSEGSADAMVGNVASSAYLIRRMSLTNLKVAGALGEEHTIHFAVRRDWPQLLSILDKSIDSIGSKQREEISKRWVVLRFEPEVRYGPILWVALGSLLVIALVLFWNQKLATHRRNAQLAREEAERARQRAEHTAQELQQLKDDLERLVQERTEELSKTQQRFYRAQKMEALGTLVGGLAHDFNNLLSAMLGSIELVREEVTDPNTQETLNLVYDMGLRSADLITQLLAFARKEQAGKEPLFIEQVIEGVRTLAETAIPKTIELNIETRTENVAILGNLSLLQQAIINLLTNARDAVCQRTEPRVRLRVSLATPELIRRAREECGELPRKSFVALEVSDNGPGIDEAKLEQLFEPFFTTKSLGRGTGLGLPMVFGAVRDHGGAVWACNGPEGGAAFTVLLPLLEAPPISREELARRQVICGRGETVLLVEDDAGLRRTHRIQLSRFGYDVLEAADGEHALRLFETCPARIQLVLLDVILPRMDGVSVAEQLRRSAPHLPILFLTGYEQGRAARWVSRHTRARLLRKPTPGTELSRALRELLELAQTAKAAAP